MGSGPRFPRELVVPHVEMIVSAVGADRVMPCGSYRRECASMGDIDLVVLDESDVVSDLLSLGLKLVDDGFPRKEFLLDVPWFKRGLKVDLWIPVDGRIGSCIVHATGSGMHNVLMRRFGYSRGMKFTWAGVQDAAGEFVAGDTEESCFEALGWPMVSPMERESVLDWAVPLMEQIDALQEPITA